MRTIDVLWFIEHVARELEASCAIKALLEQHCGVEVTVKSLLFDLEESLAAYSPKVVVHPFAYGVVGEGITQLILGRWPEAIHINIAWEQIFYGAQKATKAPDGGVVKEAILHVSWGQQFKDFLILNGVADNNVIVNGHPTYQLYRFPYSRTAIVRADLAKKYSLNSNMKWVFVPENYRWAFAEEKIPYYVSRGANQEELKRLVNFSRKSLAILLSACHQASTSMGVEIIFRPRPATPTSDFVRFLEFFSEIKQTKIHFIKELTVRDWVLASDLVVSSYSTSLIEAYLAQKPAMVFEPIKIPDGLVAEWLTHMPRLQTKEEFYAVCGEPNSFAELPALDRWLSKNVKDEKDSLLGMAVILNSAYKAAGARELEVQPIRKQSLKLFDPSCHEADRFSPLEVERASELYKQTSQPGLGDFIGVQGHHHSLSPTAYELRRRAMKKLLEGEIEMHFRRKNLRTRINTALARGRRILSRVLHRF